jgi:fructose-specific component phosphotransferase system IIB-like protein
MGIDPKGPVRVFVLSVLILAAASGARPDLAAALEVGKKAPDFALASTTGEKISLSQFLGKKAVLIEFYGADFAPV